MIEWAKLKEDFPTLEKRLDRLEKNEQVARIRLDLLDHAGIKTLVDELTRWIIAINNQLMYNKSMTETERTRFFTERDVYQWFLGIFTSAEAMIKNVEKAINKL